MFCFTLLLHLNEKLGYNQVTYEHINLLLEDRRSIKTKNGANHAPPLIRLQSDKFYNLPIRLIYY